ncbi:hypothetical protein CPT03_03520 [Pedobacter ginsengisoli]|uniref:DUF3347 domain-containing protein n=1 Tax=Pedobacter ginsengisoli TaxID=363852 RepID=A0A2D1U1W8_9SPHI|nr:DUF3347 domain-containing protein [Pedobacter ginsengisoli]ATP55600.1 hypothetical protein CPT03_03520 [Pedobacter ginsengisoli]
MKTLIYSSVFSLLFLAACSNGSNKTKSTTSADAKVTTAVASGSSEKGTSTAAVLASYLKLKNAFTNDNDKDAAAAGNEMVTAFASFDKKSLTPEQDKAYTDIYDDAKEHAEHIGANVGNIAHQREHFDMLSKDMYDLVKLLGANQSLYVDHCPMYNNNKGAIWLSEVKDIKNPYLGKAMPTCGTVKEELK